MLYPNLNPLFINPDFGKLHKVPFNSPRPRTPVPSPAQSYNLTQALHASNILVVLTLTRLHTLRSRKACRNFAGQ